MARWEAEQEAFQGMLELIDQAERCRKLFEKANMSLPEPLRRILGEGTVTASRSISIPPPERPSRPQEAQQGWIWIDARSVSPTSLVLALLRKANTAVRAKDVLLGVNEYRPEVPSGSVFNVGSRLNGEVIKQGKAGWILLKPEKAGIIYDGQLWGSPKIFSKHELAAHRREAIQHLLKIIPGGLQTSQILGHLLKCTWVKAPVTKEQIQDDVEVLKKEGRIRRRGNSKKWENWSEERKRVTTP